VRRGDLRWYSFKTPDKKRVVLILTRDSAIGILISAPITSISIPTELPDLDITQRQTIEPPS